MESIYKTFTTIADRYLNDICIREKPDLVILQPRSPSCGVGTVYDGTFSGKLVPGNGVFAALASENGLRVANVEQILEKGRLEP